jgi:3-oxoacyl-[acyl-carrier protein] reductase
MRLSGKRAIVTGSSAGIGRAIAMALAAEGASVVINARGSDAIEDVVRTIRAAGGTAIGFAGSVAEPIEAQALADHCVTTFGGIDILVNNAGAYIASQSVTDCTLDDWHSALKINLDSTFLMCRAALPHMQAQEWGRVINAASSAGTGTMGGSGYAAAKSALFGFTRAIAADYGPYGVTANCYNPEARTQMSSTQGDSAFIEMVAHYRARGYLMAAEEAYMATIAGPEGISAWIAWLCTDAAEYLNGHVFAVESRRVSLLGEPEESRMLSNCNAPTGPFSLAEFDRLAPLVFRTANRWPRRTGEALDRWERA